MQKAIHFGAGNIGRGFIGLLLHKANYHVTFVDVQESLLGAINDEKQYQVEVVGKNKTTITVTDIAAIHSADEQLINLISEADIVTTAVGPVVLNKIAPSIAKALQLSIEQKRTKPLNIIACENAVRASSSLKSDVSQHLTSLSDKFIPEWVSFVDAAVDRIVPPINNIDNESPLLVRVEEFSEWLVDKLQFNNTPPNIDGMNIVNDLDAGVERKLFTLNTGHAICAWVGQRFGYNTIAESIADDRVLTIVKSAMQESGHGLIKKHGFDESEHFKYIDKILSRFSNPYIIDDVERVGRQPIRKLSPNERIVSPILCALNYQLPIDNLLIGAAAATLFTAHDDPQVKELQEQIHNSSAEDTFVKITGLPELKTLFKSKLEELKNTH